MECWYLIRLCESEDEKNVVGDRVQRKRPGCAGLWGLSCGDRYRGPQENGFDRAV